jgi:uncharacterized protein YhfF
MKTAKTDAFWQSFCRAKDLEGKNYDVVTFGDSSAMADELAALVVHGPKRATAGLLRDYEGEPTAVPVIGGYAVVVNGGGDPLCVFQTTDVRIGPLSSVDDSFAWDEGEGDRTREWWLAAHTSYFTRQSESEKFQMHPDILTIFERFILVWPEAGADKKLG